MKIKLCKILLCVCCVLTLAACQSSRSDNIVTGKYHNPAQETAAEGATGTETAELRAQENGESETLGADLFLITDNDMQSECLILEQMASGKQYMYSYSIATRFLDKYGNRTSVSYFEPGRVISVGEKDMQGRLLEARISDAVWEYPDITRYSVDEERGVFTIADANYAYDAGLFINSDGTMLQLSDLTTLDTLRVVGIGKKIYSVSVTTGHGDLRLENTELFEGSFIQIGSRIFSEITANMSMEIPEGTYTVAVANNGYGGSAEITVKRGQETVLDLDTLKGEGPKMGNILFAVDVEGAVVQIDGKAVDYSQPIPLQYGVHTLNVTADACDTYSKKLFVNSPEATIVIGMTENTGSSAAESSPEADEGATDEGSTQADAAGAVAGSLAGSTHASDNSSGSAALSGGAASDAEIDAIVDSLLSSNGNSNSSSSDYLSTLTQLLSSLTGSGN